MRPGDRAVIAELERRARRASFDPASDSFGPQRSYIADPSLLRCLCTTRRAGKSSGMARDMLGESQRHANASVVYLNTTRERAQKTLWEELKELSKRFALGYEANESRLSLRGPDNRWIYVSGGESKKHVRKWKGVLPKAAAFYLDEAQDWAASVLECAIAEVVMPALADIGGRLTIGGVPGPVPAGVFYDITRNPEYAQHFWSLLDNPHIKSARELIDRTCRARGVDESDPTIQREFFGRWVYDENALMFRYSPERNAGALQAGPAEGWEYVLGFDLGFDDADAVVILGWQRGTNVVHLVHEDVATRQGITELAATLNSLLATWRPLALVGDLGALGKKIGDELRRRHGLPVEAADKTRKAEHIALVNDGLRTGRILLPPTSTLAQDMLRLEWDADAKARGQLKESASFHSDVADAFLYAYRRCYAYAEKPPEEPKTDEQRQDEWERGMADRIRQQREGEWWEQAGGALGFG